jgi:hypothetical protein
LVDPALRIPQPASIPQPTVASKIADDQAARMYTGAKYLNILVRIAGDHPMKGTLGIIKDYHEEPVHERDARAASRMRIKNKGEEQEPVVVAKEAVAAKMNPASKEDSSDAGRPIIFTVRKDHTNEVFLAEEACVWHRS